MTNTKV